MPFLNDSDDFRQNDLHARPHKRRKLNNGLGSAEAVLQFSGVKLPLLRYARYQYIHSDRDISFITEEKAIDELLVSLLISHDLKNSDISQHISRQDQQAASPQRHHPQSNDEVYIELTDFYIYRNEDVARGGTLVSLHELKNQTGAYNLLFDGILELNGQIRRVKGVEFEILSVSGYEIDRDTITDEIYIQSRFAANKNIWYHLRNPAADYKPYYDDFLWLADFTKHFTCYLQDNKGVHLRHFQSQFRDWCHRHYHSSEVFRRWDVQYGSADYRQAVVAYPRYLRGEACNAGVDHNGLIAAQPIWREFDPYSLGAIKERRYPLEAPTIVTPYIAECFRDVYFADQFKVRSPRNNDHEVYKKKWKKRLGWNPRVQSNQRLPEPTGLSNFEASPLRKPRVAIGNVVGVPKDPNGLWKGQSPVWYAYVHDLERQADGRVRLHLIWLYSPEDTVCSNSRYPYANELFFSDHCNCRCKKMDSIYEEDIVAFPKITLFSQPLPETAGLFVRLTYITEEAKNSFITLDPAHLYCNHRNPKQASTNLYRPPQLKSHITVLVNLKRTETLEPAEILQILPNDRILIKAFLRKENYDASALPNELVISDKTSNFIVSSSAVIRPCNIRVFSAEEVRAKQIPAPYCYKGTGDCWIVSAKLDNGVLVELDDKFEPGFIQGFQPDRLPQNVAPLRTLDLFCGGGTLGRGIEDSGAARIEWAVDIDGSAMHTKYANSDMPPEALFWGSAVHYMKLALEGKYSRAVAAIGAVEMILAGSPCQGFSLAQPDTLSRRSRKNASMVALTLSCFDLYRPDYALLENVFGMVRLHGKNKDQQIHAQILCALVGMGYQVHCSQMHAVNQGSSQSRARIIIAISAPGLKPLEAPEPTHSLGNSQLRAICRTINGEKFAGMAISKTPFEYVSAEAATRDLPNIGDGLTGICVPFPDHRVSVSITDLSRRVLSYIPRYPRGSGLGAAATAGCIPSDLVHKICDSRHVSWRDFTQNKSFRRVFPNALFNTITTTCKPADSRGGRDVHWNDNRPLTIAEARRAQSISDHEVLIGTPAQQWKIVGNGVARTVAASLGVKLRDAWVQSNRVLGERIRLDPGVTSYNEENIVDYSVDAFDDFEALPTWRAGIAPSEARERAMEHLGDESTGTDGESDSDIVILPKVLNTRPQKRCLPSSITDNDNISSVHSSGTEEDGEQTLRGSSDTEEDKEGEEVQEVEEEYRGEDEEDEQAAEELLIPNIDRIALSQIQTPHPSPRVNYHSVSDELDMMAFKHIRYPAMSKSLGVKRPATTLLSDQNADAYGFSIFIDRYRYWA